MKASNSKGDARTVGYEGGKIHCLWRALEQGLFPFMMNEVGELTEKNKVFVAVCHALLNGMPGNGHETQRRPRRVASLVIPFGGILCYKHWKMAFFSYGTMPLHASTDAEHEFMNCLGKFYRVRAWRQREGVVWNFNGPAINEHIPVGRAVPASRLLSYVCCLTPRRPRAGGWRSRC